MGPVPPFHFPLLPQSWYIGHMRRAMREITELVQSHKLDLIIETRDARLPLTSINPAFERLLAEQAGRGIGAGAGAKGTGTTKRLIVYNKADLAQDCFQIPLQRALAQHDEDQVLFTDSRSDQEVKRVLEAAIKLARRPLDGPDDKITMLVAGMPNVGKSSILNALRRVGVRKGKAASTSSEPGHTRRLSTHIKIASDPPVYIYDTPGIMVPFLGKGVAGQETAIKLALTGGMKESLFERDLVGEYLLWRLRIRAEMSDQGWTNDELLRRLALPADTPLNDPQSFFTALAHRLQAMQRGGIPDTEHASRWLVQSFRDGKLGRWTLDGLGRGGEAVDDQRDFVEVALGHGERVDLRENEGEEDEDRERAREVRWTRTEPRRGYLSVAAEEEVTVDIDAPPEVATTSSAAETSAPLPTDSSESLVHASQIEPYVAASVTSYITYLTSLASSVDLRSAHQSRKAKKADQARIRDFKRKGHEVAKVKTFQRPARSGGSGGGRGGGFKKEFSRGGGGSGTGGGGFRGGGARKGPAIKLSSGRRRQYRR
ncbi:hypothetical protein JCM10908_003036 [Rhodotorula pacifica]|uniref:putative GTPase MTG1 n=1 Tax=Rhodotorula pacifica TaxID=1495444 RepID=UPI00317B8FE4